MELTNTRYPDPAEVGRVTLTDTTNIDSFQIYTRPTESDEFTILTVNSKQASILT